MDSQRAHTNGIPGHDTSIKYEYKVPSEEEKASSPLLAKTGEANNDRDRTNKTDLLNKSPISDVNCNSTGLETPKIDLNTINSMKTDAKVKTENEQDKLSVAYHKDEDATSTNEGVKFFGLGDDDSICSTEPSADPGPQIPDGGWGWVVVVASFLIATVADGLAFSYGLINDELVVFFDTNNAATSLIGSLFISVPLIAGPIMSALVDRYGCRKMTILGAISSTIGFVAASFSNSVGVLYVTYGLMAGLGMGLLYVTAVVCIAYWFDKRRNLAVGLGSCGVGFGTFFYSPLTTYLLKNFGWRGTLLLLAGSVLNVCVCGAVMRDPEWLILEQKKARQLSKSKRASSTMSISAKSAKSGGGESVFPGAEELKLLMKSGQTPEYILTALVASIAEADTLDATTKMNAEPMSQQHKGSSVINLPTFLRQSEKVPAEVLDQLQSNKRLYTIIVENYPSLLALRSNSEQKLSAEPETDVKTKKSIKMSMKLKLNKNKKKETNKAFETKLELVKEKLLQPIPEHKTAVIQPRQDWLTRQFGTDHHYLRDIRVHRNSIMHRGAMMNIAKYKLRASSCPDIYRNSMWSFDEEDEGKSWGRKLLDTINTTFDFNMFTEFHFLLMNLSTLVLFIWFIVPYFYISIFMEETNFTEGDGSYMLSIFGVATIIGIVGLGWAGDQPWVNIVKTYSVCLVLCGITMILFPVIIRTLDPEAPHTFYILAANSLIFGLTFSSSYSYTPSILVDLVGLDKFAMAYGLVLLSQGLGHLIGPPIAGALRDNLGAWDAAFYVSGIWVIVSGLVILVIPYTKNFRIIGDAPLCKDVVSDVEPGVRIIVAH